MARKDSARRFRGNLLWIALTVTVAAAIPVVIYLILTSRGRPAPEPEAKRNQGTVQQDLDRLAEEQALYRESVSVQIGNRHLFEAVELRKEAGADEAVARSARLTLPLLFTQPRNVLDDTLVRLFEAMPPGTRSLRSDKMTLFLAATDEEGPGLSLPVQGSLTREETSVRFEARWLEQREECALQVIYTLHNGLLFAKYHCPTLRPLPAAFLPDSLRLRLDSLTLTSGSYLEVTGLEVSEAASEDVLFAADRLEFSASRAVDRALLARGLPADLLTRAPDWKLSLDKVRADAGALAALPPFARLSGLPHAAVEAARVEVERGTAVRFVEPRIRIAELGDFQAEAVAVTTPAGERVFDVTRPRFTEERWGVSLAGNKAVVRQDAWRVYHASMDSFEISPPSNPVRLARLMQQSREWKAALAGTPWRKLDVPRLLLPASVPDLHLELHGGSINLPPMVGRSVSRLRLDGVVRGGMVEKAELGACVGRREACDELELEARVKTDALGAVKAGAVRVAGPLPARLVAERVPHLVQSLDSLDVDCRTDLVTTSGDLKANCSVAARGVTMAHKRLAEDPFTFPLLRVEGEFRLDRKNDSLELSLPKVQVGEVYFRTAFDLHRLKGLPELKLSVDFPEQNCAALLRSVPDGFAPRLEKARLTGSVWFKVDFTVDLQEIRKTIKLDIDGDLDRCDALTLGPGLDVTELNRPDYVHRVVVHGEDLGIDVGPGTDYWVPLNQIPRIVQAAAYGTEDLAFFRHNGFRTGLIRRAIILFLERGYFAYGGSTISQQLVKNLYMTRTKTLSRKFQEAVVVWKMEKEVSKERIFELYLNCIEYGPKIWGIARASRVYFGKHPTQLNGMEAAFLMGLKPDPKYGYLQYRRGRLNKHWRKNLNRVLKRLLDMEVLPYEKYDRYMRIPLRFKGQGGDSASGDDEEDRPVRTGQEDLEEL